jgi:hypothetical protein
MTVVGYRRRSLSTPDRPFPHAGTPFRCMGEGGRPELDPQTCRPTLMLIRDMADQACLDACECWGQQF